MKTHNGIDPQIQRSINKIVIRNLDKLDLSPAQRAGIVIAILEPALTAAARRRRNPRNPKKKFGLVAPKGG
jgi:hypothetical protein